MESVPEEPDHVTSVADIPAAYPGPRIDSTDVDARCADFVHRFGKAYGWDRDTTLHGVPWRELIILREQIDEHENAERDYERALHGIPAGGMVTGQAQPGEPGQPSVGYDPTQEKGTPAWQRAIQMGLVVNARNRRN